MQVNQQGNRLLKSMGIYTISNVINAAIPFLLLPILTRYLTVEDYGKLSNFSALLFFVIPIIGLNLMSAVQVIYVKNHSGLKRYLSSGLFFNLFLSLFLTILFYFTRQSLSIATEIPVDIIALICIYAFYNNVIEVLLAVWRMEEKAKEYGIFRITRTCVELGIALTLIVIYRYDFRGSIYAISYSYGIGAIMALIILFRKNLFGFEFSLKDIKHLLFFGGPLIPHVLGSVSIMYSDKLMLTHFIGIETNGIYTVGFMVGQIIGLLQNSFNQAWVPWVFKSLKEKNSVNKVRIVKYTYIYFLLILVLVAILWLVSPLIYTIIGPSFYDGIAIVFWIALGFAFNGMYKMVSVYFFYKEKTGVLGALTFITAILNIILNFFFIPKYGFEGAAYATMLSMFIQFLATWVISSRIIKMPWLFFYHSNTSSHELD